MKREKSKDLQVILRRSNEQLLLIVVSLSTDLLTDKAIIKTSFMRKLYNN